MSDKSIRPFTAAKGYCAQPAWSPNGKHIAFIHKAESSKENSDIYLESYPDPIGWKKLTSHDGTDFSPVWHPSSEIIAYMSIHNNNEDIYEINVNTQKITQITTAPSSEDMPSWTADGKHTKYVKANSYDLVVCVDVMEHIEEDVQVFKNFYASMKPGAMLIISTPSDQGGSDVHDGDQSSFIEEHVRDGYNINAIQEKLKSVGFQKTTGRYQYGAPGKIAWRLSMKYPILMLGVSKLFFMILPFYYIVAYPISFILNYADTYSNHKTGTGLIVKAWK